MAGPANLTVTGISAEEVYNQIVKAGLSRAEAGIVVGNWIVANAEGSGRIFEYHTEFAGTEPVCTMQFSRSFAHPDWTDGQSVVQAEQTTGEDGFNFRFHRIEDDLDALGRDMARAFLCLSSMRSALRTLLDEIRTEINLIHREIDKGGGPIEPTPIPGKPGKYLGATKFFSKDVHVFDTSAGMVMLPAVTGVKLDPFVNPRVDRVMSLGTFLTTPKVIDFFAAAEAVTKGQFVEAFGEIVLDNGVKVRDAVEILSPRARFQSTSALVDGVAQAEGTALRTSHLEDELMAEAFGLTGAATIAGAPIERFEVIPAGGRTALVELGLATVGDFAGKDPQELGSALRDKGIDVTGGEVAGWVAAARTLVNVR